jgi:histidine triad (HIT) family protein
VSCVFCEIVENNAPAVRLFEDDLVVSFLDIAPINPGHALVIPREHHSSITTVPEAVHGRMLQIGAKLGVAMQRELAADGFNLHLANGTCAGQVLIHTHLHVIPRYPTDGFSWG